MIQYQVSGVGKAYLGAAAAGALIGGSTANAFNFRSEGVGFEWSADSGTTRHMTMSSGGVLGVTSLSSVGSSTGRFAINANGDWLKGSNIMDSTGTPTIASGFGGGSITGTDSAFIVFYCCHDRWRQHHWNRELRPYVDECACLHSGDH
jgi:hypothetical protein